MPNPKPVGGFRCGGVLVSVARLLVVVTVVLLLLHGFCHDPGRLPVRQAPGGGVGGWWGLGVVGWGVGGGLGGGCGTALVLMHPRPRWIKVVTGVFGFRVSGLGDVLRHFLDLSMEKRRRSSTRRQARNLCGWTRGPTKECQTLNCLKARMTALLALLARVP